MICDSPLENIGRDISGLVADALRHPGVFHVDNLDAIRRMQWPCSPQDLFAWLHNQTSPKKIYWSNRENTLEIAAVGCVSDWTPGPQDELKAHLARLHESLIHADPGVRYFGGFHFDASATNSLSWFGFPNFQFQVPRFEFFRKNEQFYFAVNLTQRDLNDEPDSSLWHDLRALDFQKSTSYRDAPRVLNREDNPRQDAWRAMIQNALNLVAAGDLKKIVLARESRFNFDREIDPVALLAHLKPMTEHSTHYCFQNKPWSGFIGATPERLLKWQGQEFQTEALAGSTPTSPDGHHDRQLARQLFDSGKNTREHEFVVEYIRETLLPLCQELNYDTSVSLLRLPQTQHLLTRFNGLKDPKVSWEDVITALHPTPAVGGVPTEMAIQHIANQEPFSRGWYTGAVGWIGREEGELAVGIRCGRVARKNLYLYAGAGIVEGSDPENEWDEIENKIANFIKVFYQ